MGWIRVIVFLWGIEDWWVLVLQEIEFQDAIWLHHQSLNPLRDRPVELPTAADRQLDRYFYARLSNHSPEKTMFLDRLIQESDCVNPVFGVHLLYVCTTQPVFEKRYCSITMRYWHEHLEHRGCLYCDNFANTDTWMPSCCFQNLSVSLGLQHLVGLVPPIHTPQVLYLML